MDSPYGNQDLLLPSLLTGKRNRQLFNTQKFLVDHNFPVTKNFNGSQRWSAYKCFKGNSEFPV